MSDTADRSLRQLLAWIGERPRSYAQTMGAWRSTCPRLSIWEDALLAGLVAVDAAGEVRVTSAGQARLEDS
jgi:hypothetical protein